MPYPEDSFKNLKNCKTYRQSLLSPETHRCKEKIFEVGRILPIHDIQGNNLVEKIYFDLDENSSELQSLY